MSKKDSKKEVGFMQQGAPRDDKREVLVGPDLREN